MSDDDDAVGYGKPPKHSRFQKGRSGNPAGRPKAPKTFRTDFNDAATKPVYITENGKRQKKTKLEVALARLFNAAASGQPWAIKEVVTLRKATPDEPYNESNTPQLNENGVSPGEALMNKLYSLAVMSKDDTPEDEKSYSQANKVAKLIWPPETL